MSDSVDTRSSLNTLMSHIKSAASPFRTYLQKVHAEFSADDSGAVASYIPELSKADPNHFGISVVTVKGTSYDIGACTQTFTIQSVSKAFVYGLALSDVGREKTLERVGVEPTGEPFNSIIELDKGSHRPYNPMVNAGAIATAGMVSGKDSPERLNRLLDMLENYSGRRLNVDMAVYASEKATGHRNRSLAHLLLNFGMVGPNLDEILDLYFQQCSVLVNAHDLAVMGATLANGGSNPVTGKRAIDETYIQDVLSVMYTCGMYDYAGQWAYDVGLPAKSGVGGGICAVVPGKMGIGIYSPPLDVKGNSVRGVKACTHLSRDLGLHILGPAPSAKLFELLPELA